MINHIQSDLQKLANPEKAIILQRFFKTGKGKYGEGDIFLGISVPEQRRLSKKYANSSFRILGRLLPSKIHEYRLTALLILVIKFNKSEESGKKDIYEFYLKNSKHINNWDLVDLSAYKIVGAYLLDKDRSPLYKLTESKNVWERRISIIATFYFIRLNQFDDTLAIAERLINDDHDLIHKAVGWMLREAGKRDLETEERFLRKHYKNMPRIMLRYAIEKFDEKKRTFYLSK